MSITDDSAPHDFLTLQMFKVKAGDGVSFSREAENRGVEAEVVDGRVACLTFMHLKLLYLFLSTITSVFY